jgi:hypothetical protein
MVEEPDNLVLRISAASDARLTRFEDDIRDVKMRSSSIESQLTGLRVDVTHVLHRLDKTDERPLRIERPLELVDSD